MGLNISVKRKYKINGKEYNSIEEMPEDVREIFKKAMAAQANATGQTGLAGSHTKITFNGIEYDGIDSMPQDVRELYGKVMKAAEKGDVSSDVTLEAGMSGTLKLSRGEQKAGHGVLPGPASAESSFSARKLIISFAIIALLVLLYFLFKSR